jgi:TolA-binding protein
MVGEGENRSLASAHLLRFGAALAILVAVSLTGVALEQRSLELSRQSSLQTFRADRLEQQAAELRLRIEELQTPQRLMEANRAQAERQQSASADTNVRRLR